LANLLILGIEVKDLTESGNNLLLQMNPHLWTTGLMTARRRRSINYESIDRSAAYKLVLMAHLSTSTWTPWSEPESLKWSVSTEWSLSVSGANCQRAL